MSLVVNYGSFSWLKYYLKASMSTYRKIKDSSSQKYVQLSNMDNSLGDEKSEGDSNYVYIIKVLGLFGQIYVQWVKFGLTIWLI